jgi:Serine hydroxymethyltransferase
MGLRDPNVGAATETVLASPAARRGGIPACRRDRRRTPRGWTTLGMTSREDFAPVAVARGSIAQYEYADDYPGCLYCGGWERADVIEQLPTYRLAALAGCRNCSPTAITTTQQQKGRRP